jgi:hypothetical protein
MKPSSISASFSMDNFSLKEVTSNTGVVIGATTTTSVYGGNAPILPRAVDVAKEGQADAIGNGSASFNGTSDYISLADNDLFSFGNGPNDQAFSISAWINPVDVTGFSIISKGIFNTSGEYLLWINLGNVLSFEIYDESVSSTYELAYYNSSLASYEGSWFHVCATYDGRGGTSANAGIKLYINGENVSTTLAGGGTYVAMENLGADTYIGRYDTYYADGKISNLAVYQTELDAQTISQMASDGRFKPQRDNRFSVVDFDGRF